MRHNLSLVKRTIGMNMDQWYLIVVAIQAQLKVTKECWISSFKRVNMHPDHRVPFDEWLRILDRRGILTEESEAFFTRRMSLYDAMPAVWKGLSPDERRSIMRLIDGIYSSSTVEGAVWSQKNVLDLAKYVPLNQVFKLRACYFAAKKDSSVITRVQEERSATETTGMTEDQACIERFVQWWPTTLGDEYVEDRTNVSKRKELFSHICNTVAQKNWEVEPRTLQPSSYLDVSISDDQRSLLNPSYKNVLRGRTAGV